MKTEPENKISPLTNLFFITLRHSLLSKYYTCISMSITRLEVEHIAKLARIELAEEEKTKFAGELAAILEFVEKLGEVNTDRVLPMAGGTDFHNEGRKDEQLDDSLENKQAEMLIQAPQKKETWIKVKSVFGS